MNKDLTVGNPGKVLWNFCLPMFLSVIFQQLYNIADSLVAGKFISENALAAVGNSYNITLLFIAFSFGCNIGCSVIVSRYFGSREYSFMKTAVYTTLVSASVLCIVLIISGLISSKSLLLLMNTQPEILNDSALYLRIYILGLPFLIFYNVSTGVFAALGDSKTPFYFLAFSSCSNILMDIFMVKVLNLEVAGIAWATFICQGISCILALTLMLRRIIKLECKEKALLFSWDIFKKIAVIAIPSILQQASISIGNMMIQGRINTFGISVTAGYSAAVKLNNLVITSFTTIGNGISNFTSQNLGAGKIKRIKEGFASGVKLVWTISIPFMILYLLGGKVILMLFLNADSIQAIKTGHIFLIILSPFYFVVSAKLVADGILRGSSFMTTFMITTFTDLVIRVTLAFILSGIFNSEIGIWSAWPIGWSVAAFMSICFYKEKYKLLEQRGEKS